MRPTWTEYFMSVVDSISQRSTCDRGKPGCVFVKNNQILTTGYAGSPPGFDHCDKYGHEMEEHIRFVDETIGVNGWPAFNDAEIIMQVRKDTHTYNSAKSRYEMPPSQHCIRTIHAEQNAILQAARRGISLDGSMVYVSMTPCRTCTMMLISIGVSKIIAKKLYQKAQESIDMLKKANIPIEHLDQTVQQYE
jgi:dCMP deaminase